MPCSADGTRLSKPGTRDTWSVAEKWAGGQAGPTWTPGSPLSSSCLLQIAGKASEHRAGGGHVAQRSHSCRR